MTEPLLLLLLGGYDKGVDPSPKRQQAEIKVARGRLIAWRRVDQLKRKRATKSQPLRP